MTRRALAGPGQGTPRPSQHRTEGRFVTGTSAVAFRQRSIPEPSLRRHSADPREITVSVAVDEAASKPGSVHCPKAAGDHLSRAYVAAGLMRSTRKLGRAALERFLSDLAPGGVYRAARVTPGAGGLLHHRFTLTAQADPYGGLLSVALSRESPRVGVTHHLALWSPDFPRRGPKTSTRPPGRLVHRTDRVAAPGARRVRL
ncbi:MAG: hypothetical protein QOF82_1132 [Frankiales bacterium]|nr:hypothetical protein [Frankiales bacterium]